MVQMEQEMPRKSLYRGLVTKLGVIWVCGLLVASLYGAVAQANSGQISGTVRNQHGEPVNSVNVTLYRRQIDPSGFVWWQNYQYVTTNMSGTYDLTAVEEGVYRIGFDDAVSPRRYLQEFYDNAPTIDVGNSLTVTAGAVITGIDAQLLAGGRITGVVTNESGQPLSGIRVQVYPDPANGNPHGTFPILVNTDGNGIYEVTGLPTDSYIIEFNQGLWSNGYLREYYDNVAEAAAATPVPVTAGAIIANINAQLASTSNLEGLVTNTQGAPLANLHVTLYGRLPDVPGDNAWYIVNYVTTNVSGTYRIDQIYPGVYRLGFSDKNFPKRYLDEFYDDVAEITAATNITVTASQTISGLNAVLGTGSHLQGLITAFDGAPLDQIAVSAYRYQLDSSGLFDTWTSVSAQVTDGSGAYRIGGLTPGRYRLGVLDRRSFNEYFPEFYDNAPTLEAATDITLTANATITLDISMTTGGRITGLVTNAAGAPIEGIQVTRYQYVSSPGGDYWSSSLAVTTNISGTYQIGGLRSGRYRVTFHDHPWPIRYLDEFYLDAPTLISATDILVNENATTANINAQLDAAAQITGVVRDLQGAPLANMMVRAESLPYDDLVYSGYATTNSSGSYTIEGLRPATYRVSFADSNWWHEYATEYYDDVYELAEASYLTLTIGQTLPHINALLAPSGQITGLVTNEAGEPLPEILINLYRKRTGVGPIFSNVTLQSTQLVDNNTIWWEPLYKVIHTNEAGIYHFPGLDPGVYRLAFTDTRWPRHYLSEYYDNAGLFENAHELVLTPGGVISNVNASLQSAGRIAGQVTNQQGAGLPNIEVRIYRHLEWGWYWYYSLSTDASGAYDIRIAENGDYRIGFFDATGRYAHQYYNGADHLENAATLTLNQGTELTNIHGMLGEAGRITGAVTDANGAPLAGIHAWLYRYANGAGEWLGETVTDQNGVYVMGGLGNERYRLFFFDPTGAYAYEYYDNRATLAEATDVTGTVGMTVTNINVALANPAPPVATISADSGSVTVDTHTGEVTIAMPRGNRSDITITRTVTCADGGLPTLVELVVTIGGNATTYTMTPGAPGSAEYHATIPPSALIGNAVLTVKSVCAGLTVEVEIGQIQLYDPSGIITDAATGQPIQGATVTLYKAPGWRAKSSAMDNEPNTCQSHNSKSANEPWSQPAPTEVGQVANPLSGEISPAVSAMQTDNVGHYGWDVAAGCWYVVVEAPGYQSKVSPVVGVPPAVTDLNLTLNTNQVAAAFTSAPQVGSLPLTVHFTSTATGPVNAWLWRFGDGAVSNSPNPTHTYTTAGMYAASLTVQGPTNSSTTTQTIMVRDLPIGALHVTHDGPSTLGAATNFSASVTSGSAVVYVWNFGDGSVTSAAVGATPSHIYPAPGFYTAQVTAANSISQVTGATLVEVKNVAIQGLVAASSSPGLIMQALHFTATVASGSNVDYAWNFGDGATGAGVSATHAYTQAGLYTATVTATNSEGMVTASIRVTVRDVAIAGLTLQTDSPKLVGQASHLTATVASGSGVSYQWDLGDGASATGATVSHLYAAAGVYTVTVTASNSAGQQQASRVVTVIAQAPTDTPIQGLTIVPHHHAGATGQPIQFQATITAGANVLYQWDFGDGATATGANVNHTYTKPGSYTVRVTATNGANSMSAAITLIINSSVYLPLVIK